VAAIVSTDPVRVVLDGLGGASSHWAARSSDSTGVGLDRTVSVPPPELDGLLGLEGLIDGTGHRCEDPAPVRRFETHGVGEDLQDLAVRGPG